MESSEDDAGAATIASRRASARERDVGGGEDGGASAGMPQEPVEAGASSETASISEEAFDADSVPSPSAQDVNTSTEAILDMIDEIVDGPDATRRRSSHASPDVDTDGMYTVTDGSTFESGPLSNPGRETFCLPTPVSVISPKSETVSQECASEPTHESEPQIVAPISDIYVAKLLPESANNTGEDSTSAITPTGVASPTELLHDNSDNSKQEDIIKGNTLATDIRLVINENLQNEHLPCQAVSLPVESFENVTSECVSEPLEVLPADDSQSGEQPTHSSTNDLQSDNVHIIETTSEDSHVVLSQSTSELTTHAESPQASSSVPINEAAESTSTEAAISIRSEAPSNLSPSLPSSSVVEMVQIVSDSSENQICEWTIKCVTSSDSRDNVTVESAESTSSESSCSSAREERAAPSEQATRSPLRRRLVRPAPSDRRPDSTVSSSVDSQNIHVDTTEQTTSESVTKDVSSSSDAVTSVYCNIKPEEIRVSEISVCKAETSMSPPKKIKLVRQKLTPPVAQRENTPEKSVSRESEQCQSTSSECTPSVPQDSAPTSSGSRQTVQSIAKTPSLSYDCVTNNPVSNLPDKSNENSEKNFHEGKVELPICGSPTQPLDHVLEKEEKINKCDEEKRVPPIKLNLSISTETTSSDSKLEIQDKEKAGTSSNEINTPDCTKQVPKLTIKLGSKQSEEAKSAIPKFTIKPNWQLPENENSKRDSSDQIASITKINIKPIPKPAEKVNDIHRKSSSSEISESESSENDESNSMSDPASNSDQGVEMVPKVTIKVGKPGTESEGKFYTEQNAPKLLIKGLQSNENEERESTSKLKLVISQPEEKQPDKIPKLTIKNVSKTEGQSVSPKLSIKAIRPPDNIKMDRSAEFIESPTFPKMKIIAESLSSNVDKDNIIPKITIKPVVKCDAESSSKAMKKSLVLCDSPDHIPIVTKLNIKPVLKPIECETMDHLEERIPVISKLHIKPILKPVDSGETSKDSGEQIPVISKLNIKPIIKPPQANEITESADGIPIVSKINIKPILKPTDCASEGTEDKVPVVSKLNIKPVIKPKDSEVESSLENIPVVTKLNIKPLRNPEEKSSEDKDCDVKNAESEDNSIPVVTKINIKPIIKPIDEDTSKDSENQSSETGNSSDDNGDHIPVVTKINIKPIVKPNELEQDSTKTNIPNEESIPVVTKLNIKPLIKPDDCKSPSSPKRDVLKITKLNIKPVVKPEEVEQQKDKHESEDISIKNPPLLMKINIKNVTDTPTNDSLLCEGKKVNTVEDNNMVNNTDENIPKVTKINIKPIQEPFTDKTKEKYPDIAQVLVNCRPSSSQTHPNEIVNQNCVPDKHQDVSCRKQIEIKNYAKEEVIPIALQKQTHVTLVNETNTALTSEVSKSIENQKTEDSFKKAVVDQVPSKPQSTLQNCTLLKKLLETKKDGLDKRLDESMVKVNHSQSQKVELTPKAKCEQQSTAKVNSEKSYTELDDSNIKNMINDVGLSEIKTVSHSLERKQSNESYTKPLEISISDKITSQSSGQDSPRIILKINKTDHGPSAKIITEERPNTPLQNDVTENTQEIVNDKQGLRRVVNSRKKPQPDTPTVHMGKRLRSSRIVEEKTPVVKKNLGKRLPSTETNPLLMKESEHSVLETKRLKLGQLLSNKSLTITPVATKSATVSATKSTLETRQTTGKPVNHSLLNNENCSKNGNSKLHNILSNLQAKQAQALALNEITMTDNISITPELESNTSTGSSDVVEVVMPVENSHPDVMIINDNSESRDLLAPTEDVSQDPLEVEPAKPPEVPSPVPLTPQPKKRGRPRKLPLSEGAKPAPVVLPIPALEERPQRSLRLSRERPTPTILAKPRGRGRGRGARRAEPEQPREEPVVDTANKFYIDEKPIEDIDPTSSRIKLPRMTEALDKLPACTTPLSSRRRSSSTSTNDMKLFDPEPKVVLNILPKLEEALKSPPETPPGRGGRGGRGRRGGRGHTPARTPRSGRGRGRGGGRGAQYMKETMGIYGRVCGPATTTVQLFEEETCMMDDNATPAKSAHFIDEDSQSSVLSSTNDSNRMKKSKFADLFDSNKVWTAADVKEYMWPPPETTGVERQVMMIQEQVAMFLGVKSFKRRYPELKRRPVAAEERDYVLSKGLVTEALCDLGITAVDASEVLDIMLSDYPHKYEEYRQHQRQRQVAEANAVEEPAQESKPEQKMDKVEMKVEPKPVEAKPEPPKVDIEKTRQEAMAAAIASASEWNARLNALRRGACVDLQTHTVHRRRPPPTRAPTHVRPPAGFYPHALLPGQYQHGYCTYSADLLGFFPLNTVTAAPPPPPSPPPSESESEPEFGCSSSSEDSDSNRPTAAKRKKLSKTKRSSQAEAGAGASGGGGGGGGVKEEAREEDLCRVCKLRLEANRKYTHERFLVCATCGSKLHPGCVELCADTVRKAREYGWQCARCKACCGCGARDRPHDMLFCDLCDRGFHTHCVGLPKVPSGRWHCVECAICKSCGAREPSGPPAAGTSAGAAGGGGAAGSEEPTWHHQTKRGPGGHKVYSHSLCTPCARAYRIGRYCPLCERSFIGPKGTMQLVICKLCDRQHHQECVKQTVAQLNVLDYTCAECRRGGITSRSAAARLAPRTIATLFMAKRRFNKYAHRQYMQSRLAERARDDTDESREPAEPAELAEPAAVAPDDASDAWECGAPDTCDPLEGVGGPLEAVAGPLEDAIGPIEAAIGPLEDAIGPLEDAIGPLEDAIGPLEDAIGPIEAAIGPLEDAIGPLEAAGDPLEAPPDEATAAVAAMRMDFGD